MDIIDPNKVIEHTDVIAPQKVIDVANSVTGIIQLIGTIFAVVAIMVIGIKYILGSVEERAEYKKVMWPYIIGIVFIFLTSNVIVPLIYNTIH